MSAEHGREARSTSSDDARPAREVQPAAARAASPRAERPLLSVVPLAFVFLWSTGWIVARYAADYSDPITFLTVRYGLAALALAVVIVLRRAPWPRSPTQAGHAMVSGMLIHGFYLAGVYWAVAEGVPASISALLAAIQPILSAALAPWLLHERLSMLQVFGVGLGFAGLLTVVAPKLGGHGAPLVPLAVNAVSMVSVTFGAFYQKRFVREGDLACIVVLQYVGAIAVSLPLALAFETLRMTWNVTIVAVMAWSVLAISVGAVLLLMVMIRHGAVSKQAQLIYLVPPAAAVQAWLLFGERLSPLQLAGMAIALAGVVLATRGRSTA